MLDWAEFSVVGAFPVPVPDPDPVPQPIAEAIQLIGFDAETAAAALVEPSEWCALVLDVLLFGVQLPLPLPPLPLAPVLSTEPEPELVVRAVPTVVIPEVVKAAGTAEFEVTGALAGSDTEVCEEGAEAVVTVAGTELLSFIKLVLSSHRANKQ